MAAVNPDPSAYGSPEPTVAYGASPAYEAPSYSAYADEPAQSTPTYQPAATPTYAPPGYGQPPPYAPPAQVGYAPPAAPIAAAGSRVTAALLSAVLGLVLVAAGVFLVAKYGFDGAINFQRLNSSTNVTDLALTAGGGVLLLAAVVLNGWSAWATVVPGVVLSGLGGWALASPSAFVKVSKLTNFVFKNHEFDSWHLFGFTLVLGLVLLAGSLAAAIARTAGRRSAPSAP